MGRVGFFGTAPLLFILYKYKLPLFYRELKSLHSGYKIINTYKIKLDHNSVGNREIYEMQNKIHTDSHVTFLLFILSCYKVCLYERAFN